MKSQKNNLPLQLCLAISALLPPCTQSWQLLRSRIRRCYIRVTDCQGLESTLTIMSPFSPVSGIVQLFLKSIPLVLGTNLSLEVLKSISNLQDNMLKKESRQHTTFMIVTSCSQECSNLLDSPSSEASTTNVFD